MRRNAFAVVVVKGSQRTRVLTTAAATKGVKERHRVK